MCIQERGMGLFWFNGDLKGGGLMRGLNDIQEFEVVIRRG